MSNPELVHVRQPANRYWFAVHRALLIAVAVVMLAGACADSSKDEPIDSKVAELTPAQAALAKWSAVIPLTLLPTSAANLPDGKVLLWSSGDRFDFGGQGQTFTTIFNPATETATERLVTETHHNMFCPGTANLPDGRILVNGGLDAGTTSIFDPVSGAWTNSDEMNIPRAYEGTTPLADGSVFTLGGSWNGGVGNKHGELWTQAAGWRTMPGILIDPFLSVDTSRDFGMDSHLWLLQAGNGKVFHAGPGVTMHWVDTRGNGSVTLVGPRGDDAFSINGGAVMFDAGKILKTGGAPGYQGLDATADSYVIELGVDVTVRKVQPMAYRRTFHNHVVLPNGQVVIIGGQTVALSFSDTNSVLVPEIFDPVTETFTSLPAMTVPRNYHGVAILLADGRVLASGSGLCGNGCAANHPNIEILSPPYLFNADGSAAVRPVIVSAAAQAAHGTKLPVTTNSAIASFSLVRMSSTTHALNNDQRRLSVTFTSLGGNNYEIDIPSNPGWAVPGLYMLFAMNAAGVPSVSRVVRIGSSQQVTLVVGDQRTNRGASVSVNLTASNPGGLTLTYGAQGLPPGVTLNASNGRLRGTATTGGRYPVKLSVTDGTQTTSTEIVWLVREPGSTRYFLFEALSEVNGDPYSSMGELNLLDENGDAIPRAAWTITADSEQLTIEDGHAVNAIDGDPFTMWHTAYTNAPLPHWLRVDLGENYTVTGFRYMPRRPTVTTGTVANYRVSLSTNGVDFGTPVALGSFVGLGSVYDEKTIYFDNVARGKVATQSSTASGNTADRAVDGNTNGVLANGSVSRTNSSASPYWEVDLGQTHRIFGARVYGRTDCCADRLSNFYVLASSASMQGRSLTELLADSSVLRAHVAGTAPTVQLHNLPGEARYVRVQLAGTNSLELAEVEVYGRLLADAPPGNQPPVFVTPEPPQVGVGESTSFLLEAEDPEGDPLTFSAVGLPPGLALDASTGLITGTTTLAGNFSVTAGVSDDQGGSDSAQFTWQVGNAPPVVEPVVAPLITSGTTGNYTASAAGGGTLEYRWNFGDGSPQTPFSTNPGTSHAFPGPGVYTVTLTVRNGNGGATSTEFMQAVGGSILPGQPVQSSNLVFTTGAQGSRLYAVNIDNDSVSVFNATKKLTEIAVGKRPRGIAVGPDGRVWVTNSGSNTISIIDPALQAVIKTVKLPRGSQPFGIVLAANNTAFVALEATGEVHKLNKGGSKLAVAAVGGNPRHLALTAAGDRLLVSRFITPPLPGEATANVKTQVGGVKKGAEVLIYNTSDLSLRHSVVLQHSDKPDTTISGRGFPNYLGAPVVSPDGQSAWVPSKQDNLLRGMLRDGLNLDFQNTVRAISSRINLVTEAEDYAARIDLDNSGIAVAAAFHPSGAYLFVALEASRHVAVLDAYGRRELFRVDTGRAPQALALSSDGLTLYVHNALDRSVGRYNLAPLVQEGARTLPLVATVSSVATEALSAQVLRGKQFFYDARDPRLARDAYLSCATCHNDGGSDGRIWDLTGLGEGLRNTIELRGRGGAQGNLHWTANFDEVQDFEGQIRTLSDGTGLMTNSEFQHGTREEPLGDAKAGVSEDLDALAAYVNSLASFDFSPYRTTAGKLTPEAALGRVVFGVNCVSCHGGSAFTDSSSAGLHNVGTLKPSSGQRLGETLTGLDTPTLRDVWATAPFLHNGSAPSIQAAIEAHTGITLPSVDLLNVSAFVNQIGSEEPAVEGLLGEYFLGKTLSGTAVLKRIEKVAFAWNEAAPGPGVTTNNFSVRWTGSYTAPSTGDYRFRTVANDGVRLWIGGLQLVDNWVDREVNATNTTAPIPLQSGQRVAIRLEYYDNTGAAAIQLKARVPGSTSYPSIPITQLSAQ